MSKAFTSRQAATAGWALALANLRYWTSVAPPARREIGRWEQRALGIPDPALRALAIRKLRAERFNVEVAATLATPAPRARRGLVVAAIVALQVMYDYLDVLTEQPVTDELSSEPTGEGRRLFQALSDALGEAHGTGGEYYRGMEHSEDGGYLRALVDTVRLSLETLPATGAIAEVGRHAAARCAEAQVLGHAAARSGAIELERWAKNESRGSTLGWVEFLAGAQASVLALHALVAAAADESTTEEDARQIDTAYLSIGALTMLDSLIDREEDLTSGALAYIDYYDSRQQMALCLAAAARDAVMRIRTLPHSSHHLATLAGVVAYYASAPTASESLARPVFARVRGELRPLIAPTVAVMRVWRLAKSKSRLTPSGSTTQDTTCY